MSEEQKDRVPSQEDEISLVDLCIVLVRNKWLVLGLAAVCLGIGLGYAMLRPVKYTYRTGIELSRIYGAPVIHRGDSFSLNAGKTVLLEKTGETVSVLRDEIIPAQRGIVGTNPGAGIRVEIEAQKDLDRLILRSKAGPAHAGAVKKMHEAAAKALVKKHATILEKELNLLAKPFKKRETVLTGQIQDLAQQLRKLSGRTSETGEIQSLIQAQEESALRRELAEARLKLSDTQSASEVIREAGHGSRIRFLSVQSGTPDGPGKTLIAVLALVLGIMLGVFGAFFKEFLQNARNAYLQSENNN